MYNVLQSTENTGKIMCDSVVHVSFRCKYYLVI